MICHRSSYLDLVYIMKEGFQHGIHGKFVRGQSFDDAEDLTLSYTDRCIGVEVYWVDKYLASIRFFYSNGRYSADRPRSHDQLVGLNRSSNKFTLYPTEEINKVVFYEHAHRTDTNDSSSTFQMKGVMVGVEFRTTTGRKSDLFGSDDGSYTAESFLGYTFRCAKGRRHDVERIETLQLVWFKLGSSTEENTKRKQLGFFF